MIKKNDTNKRIILYLPKFQDFVLIEPGEHARIEEEFIVFKEIDEKESKPILKTMIKKIKK